MSTQALHPLLDPRGDLFAWAAPLAVVLAVAGAALVDRLREKHRDPAGVLAVTGLMTARRAMARVVRLEATGGSEDGAVVRHLASVSLWAFSARTYGTQRRRRAAAALLHTADEGLRGYGLEPVEVRCGGYNGHRTVECSESADLGGVLGPDRRYA